MAFGALPVIVVVYQPTTEWLLCTIDLRVLGSWKAKEVMWILGDTSEEERMKEGDAMPVQHVDELPKLSVWWTVSGTGIGSFPLKW